MDYVIVPYLWVNSLLLILYVILFVFAWDIRTMPGSKYYMAFLVLCAFWSVAQGLEFSAVKLEAKIIWANLQYLSVMTISAVFFLYVLAFTRRYGQKIGALTHITILAAPILFNIFVWVTPELVRQNVYLNISGAFPTVGKDYGPLFWIMSTYNYAVTLLAIVKLFMALREKTEIVKKQIITIIIAAIIPTIANVMQIAKVNPFNVDLTPVFFGISSLVLTTGIVRYNLFRVLPVARSLVIKVMKTGMIVIDDEERLIDINPAALKLLKLGEEPIIGQKLGEVFGGLPQLMRIFDMRKDHINEITFEKDGTNYYYEVSLTGIRNNSKKEIGWLLQIYDITERKLAEDIIEFAAYHDNLTGLPNRQYFQLQFSQELALARMRGHLVTVGFVDIDNFKAINDSYGHDTGDTILREAADRLRSVLRESDIIARLGGDEFAIVIPGVGTKKEIVSLGERLLEAFDEKIELGGVSIKVGISIGFSLFPVDGDNIEVLLQKSDKAMYAVKSSGKNNFCLYDR